MVRRISWTLLVLVAIAALVPIATLWYATCTESGLRLVIKQLSHRIGPVTLWIDGGSGTFADGFRIEHFRLLHERADVRADGVTGRVSVLPLLWATIKGHDVSIDRAFVRVLPRVGSATPLKQLLPPFLSIYADGTRIRAATLIVINGQRFDGSNLVASGALRSHDMRFRDISFTMGELSCLAGGTLTAHEPLQLTAQTRWTWAPVNRAAWLFTADINGDLSKLELHTNFATPFKADFTGALLDLTEDWHWQGNGVVQSLDIRTWGGGGALGRLSGSVAMQGNHDGFSAHGPIDFAGLKAGIFDLLFVGKYADQVLSARRIQLIHRASHASVDVRGSIGIVAGGPRLDLKGNWREFQWPLRGTAPALTSAAGEFTLTGVLPFDVQASGRLKSIHLPELPLQLRGVLGRDGLTVRDGSAALWGGRASFAGEAVWSPQKNWSVSGRVSDLDVAQLRVDVPGRLSFDLRAKGNQFDDETDLDIDMRNLAGRLRGAAARGYAHVLRKDREWHFDHVSVAAGGMNLALDGDLGSNTDLDFKLDASDLSILASDARGRLNAKGSVRGTLQAPILRLLATGSNLKYGDLTLRSVDSNIDVDTRAGRDLHADIRLGDLASHGRVINHLDISLAGHADSNRVKLSAQAASIHLSAIADGAFANAGWRGRWQKFTVDDSADLHLTLQAPAELRVASASGNVERFCLKGSQANWCGMASWDPQQWSVDNEANELPLSALTAGLTPGSTYEGRLDAKAHLFATGGGPVEGSMHAELSNAQLRRRRSNSREDLIRLGSGTVTLSADRLGLHGTLGLDAKEVGKISGELFAQRSSATFSNMPLRANIKASTRELNFLNIYVPDIDRAAGKLVADISLAGTLGQPLVNGSVELTDGELDLYQINLQLRQVAASAKLTGNHIAFSGSAKAAEGALQANGDLAWSRGAAQGLLQFSGKNLLLVNVPEARITASPELKFSIKDRQVDVTGTITIPSARIAPADLTGAVLSSSDEVLTGQATGEAANKINVYSNVRMVFGDHVSVDTFGLSGRLTGSITVQTGEDDISRATGELSVADGKYAAFGRRLDVERGRLIFGGGLLGDPGVDLRATKQFPNTIAGVNVRGSLRQPRMTFFSEPALPQAQIVSLILAGGSIEGAQNTDKAGAARGELLAQGGAILAQQLGQRVGVDDVGIEQSLTNETSLVLGKYLSPRLYVSYGISLAESINTIKMRYTIGDRWTIKTEAGLNRSADLVYTIDK